MTLAPSPGSLPLARQASSLWSLAVKLEPVYLLAPQPDQPGPRGLSRRAVMGFAIGSFAFGFGVGAALRLLGRREPSDESSPSDRELAWARDLARGPIETLLAESAPYLQVAGAHGRSETILRDGLLRLADAACGETLPAMQRRDLARGLIVTLSALGDAARPELAARIPALRRITR